MAQTSPARSTKKFDPGVPAGLVFGFAMILGAFIIEGGDPASLVLPTPFMIVIGGTVATLTMTFPLHVLMKTPKYLNKALFSEEEDPLQAVQTFVRLADKARREGLLSLEDEAATIHDEFMKDGIQEVVDGTAPEQISELLEIRISEMEARHREGFSFFEQGGGFSPTMGIIGTVLGLVVTLSNLGGADAGVLGHSIAVAFIATLYGIMAANLFWLPVSARLRKKSESEVAHKRMLIEGILAIQAGDAPRLVRNKLEGFLSPVDRVRSQQMAQGGAGAPAAAAA